MRIAYLLHWHGGSETGVFKKIVAQVRQWSINGLDVGIFIFSRVDCTGNWVQALDEVPVFLRTYGGFANRFDQVNALVNDIIKWNPTLVYFRHDLYYPGVRRLGDVIPLVLEINTDDLAEYRLGLKHRNLYNRLTRDRLLSFSRNMVFVSNELSQLRHFSRHCKNIAVIANGIELQDYPCLPAPDTRDPRLVFIGTPGQAWQGIDKVLWLANRFPSWQFDLIGTGSRDVDSKLPPNVVAHGLINRDRYEPILTHADIAIGTLALHRKGLSEASPLKTREYLAYGIPTIIGYQDTDFLQPVPYLLQLSNTPTNIEEQVTSIQQFVQAWKGRRVPRAEIAHIDAHGKEKLRISFFQQVLKTARRSQ